VEVRLKQKLIFIFSVYVTFYVVILQLTKSAISTVWRGKFLHTSLLRIDTVIISYPDMANWTESALCGMKKMMKIGAEKYHVELMKV